MTHFKETTPMTLREIIQEKGLKKEYIIEKTGIPRNRFYCNLKKPHKFRKSELEDIAKVLNITPDVIIESVLQ